MSSSKTFFRVGMMKNMMLFSIVFFFAAEATCANVCETMSGITKLGCEKLSKSLSLDTRANNFCEGLKTTDARKMACLAVVLGKSFPEKDISICNRIHPIDGKIQCVGEQGTVMDNDIRSNLGNSDFCAIILSGGNKNECERRVGTFYVDPRAGLLCGNVINNENKLDCVSNVIGKSYSTSEISKCAGQPSDLFKMKCFKDNGTIRRKQKAATSNTAT